MRNKQHPLDRTRRKENNNTCGWGRFNKCAQLKDIACVFEFMKSSIYSPNTFIY